MSGRPRYSVVIPAYNYGAMLGTAIDSVLLQNRDDVEVVVLDDASTDDTPEVAAGYGDRVRYMRNADNSGHPTTWGRAMAAASGEYIVNLDADDWLLPGYFARMDAATTNNIGFAVTSVYDYRIERGLAQLRPIAVRDEIMSASKFRKRLLSRIFFRTPGMLLRRSLVEKSAAPDARIWNADWEFLLRATKGAAACIIAEPFAVYRIHPNSVSGKAAERTDRLQRSCELFLSITRDPESPAFLPPDERRIFAKGVAELYLRIQSSRMSARDIVSAMSHLHFALRLAGSEHLTSALATTVFFAEAVMEKAAAAVLGDGRRTVSPEGLLPRSATNAEVP